MQFKDYVYQRPDVDETIERLKGFQTAVPAMWTCLPTRPAMRSKATPPIAIPPSRATLIFEDTAARRPNAIP